MDDPPSPVVGRQWARLRDYYEPRLARFGDDVRTLDWGSRELQERRFAVLTQAGLRPGQTVLDVGAGLGDLCGYLTAQDRGNPYTGLDVVGALTARAQTRFPQGRFLTGDLRLLPYAAAFDLVCASGIFNVRVPGWSDFFQDTVRAMLRACRVAVAFNLLSMDATVKNPRAVYCRPERIWRFCRTLTPHVVLRHDYLPHDFTVYLYPSLASPS